MRLAAAREILDRSLGKPMPAEQPAVPAQQVVNVVRVPLPAQSMEEWQKDVDAWREQQARLQRPVNVEQLLRQRASNVTPDRPFN